MNERPWTTMKDVAARAGVGTITVSRVLRTPDKVAAQTRERVEEAIRALGYVPDETAGSLSSNRSRVIGALVSTLSDSVFASTVEGLSGALREAGRELLIADTGYEPAHEEALIRALLGRRPDGLVLTSTRHTEAARRLLTASGVGVVEVWELPERPVGHVVGFSNRRAGRALAQHLIRSGRRRIAFIGGRRAHDERGRLRALGYADAMAAARLGPPLFADNDPGLISGADIGASGLARALAHWPDLDAVMCVSDAVAAGALCEAARRGLSVPETLAVTGFGGFDLARESALDLTTIEAPGAEIGAKAAELLLTAGPGAPPRMIDLGFRLVRRATG